MYFSDRMLAIADAPAPGASPEAPEIMNLNLPSPRFGSGFSFSRLQIDRSGLFDSQGLSSLREAVSQRAMQREGLDIDATRQVLVTPGATGALATAFDAFVNAGDQVVMLDPGSTMFARTASQRRARVRWVPTWTEEGRLRFLGEGLRKAMRGAMMVVLADPSHPSGGVMAEEDLEEVAWAAKRHDVLVFLDRSLEAFQAPRSVAPLGSRTDVQSRWLVAGSVSQEFGLASLRVGWMWGPQPLIRACRLAAQAAGQQVPTISQELALQALMMSREMNQPLFDQLAERRRYTLERLRGIGFEPTIPGGGFCTWVSVAQFKLGGREFANRLLREKQVVVGTGADCGPSGDAFIRVSFANEDGRLREGLSRLTAFVQELNGVAAPRKLHSEAQVEVANPKSETEIEPTFSRV
jgi:aspartate/methionine/tyrosine aminotransferase